MRIATECLAGQDTCLVITAEGSFTDPRLRPIRLRPGIAHLARRLPDAVVLPLALEYSFWNESKPEALLRFGAPVRPVAPEGEKPTVAHWQHALEAALTDTMDALAAASAARDPAGFTRLFAGTAGVGGPYDAWRPPARLCRGPTVQPAPRTGPALMVAVFSWLALALAALPFCLLLDNLRRFRRPGLAAGTPAISVLIPARNEAANIGPATAAILASQGVTLELIVLDDGSTDETPHILAAITDPRLRTVTGSPLPPGWSGKQHACAGLARLATYGLMVFVDADVRLAPDALSRMAQHIAATGAGLASGFPRQITSSWSEILLLPLIHFLLLGYLPIIQMNRSCSPGLGAGCGQLFIARADAYAEAGGHAAIRASCMTASPCRAPSAAPAT